MATCKIIHIYTAQNRAVLCDLNSDPIKGNILPQQPVFGDKIIFRIQVYETLGLTTVYDIDDGAGLEFVVTDAYNAAAADIMAYAHDGLFRQSYWSSYRRRDGRVACMVDFDTANLSTKLGAATEEKDLYGALIMTPAGTDNQITLAQFGVIVRNDLYRIGMKPPITIDLVPPALESSSSASMSESSSASTTSVSSSTSSLSNTSMSSSKSSSKSSSSNSPSSTSESSENSTTSVSLTSRSSTSESSQNSTTSESSVSASSSSASTVGMSTSSTSVSSSSSTAGLSTSSASSSQSSSSSIEEAALRVLSVDQNAAKIYLRSGQFTSTIQDSESLSSIDTDPTDCDFDGVNTTWAGSQADKLYKTSGVFTSTIKTSQSHGYGSPGEAVFGIANDGNNTPCQATIPPNHKSLLFSGSFTATLKTSISRGSHIQWGGGVATSNKDDLAVWNDGGTSYDKLLRWSGQYSSTLRSELDVWSIDYYPGGIGYDGSNTLWTGAENDKHFLQSGLFTSTIKTSLSVGAGSFYSGIATYNHAGKLA